jgi:curved DNA-binding protein CbpA
LALCMPNARPCVRPMRCRDSTPRPPVCQNPRRPPSSVQDACIQLALGEEAVAEATAAFQRLGEAHRVLSDPAQRALYDQKLVAQRTERQRAERAAEVRREMAELEQNVRAKLSDSSSQVWTKLFAVREHHGDPAGDAATEAVLHDLRIRGDRPVLSAALNRRRFAVPLDMWL